MFLAAIIVAVFILCGVVVLVVGMVVADDRRLANGIVDELPSDDHAA